MNYVVKHVKYVLLVILMMLIIPFRPAFQHFSMRKDVVSTPLYPPVSLAASPHSLSSYSDPSAI